MTSLGFIVGSCFAVFFTLLGLFFVVGGLSMRRSSNVDTQDAWPITFGLGVIAVVATVVLTAFIDYPYDMQYHRYVKIEGTIDSIQARTIADDHGSTQQFAVRFRGTGEVRRCDDTRCALLHEGDWLSLWCIRDYQYASTPGWVCNFADAKPKG